MKNNFGLSERDMQTLQDIFKKYPEVEEVHLFGSRAKGSFKTGSDIDLAIMNKGVSIKNLRKLKTDFEESSLPYNIDLVNFNAINNVEFIDHINRVGILFYKKKVT